MSQPAAAQAIARLEQGFGPRLLERTASGVVSTKEGMIVQARAIRAFANLAEISRRVGRAKPGQGAGLPWAERHVTSAQLRAVVSFAEGGSFAAAARSLNQTDPAVQRTARALDTVIGVALFECTKSFAAAAPLWRRGGRLCCPCTERDCHRAR